MPTREAIERFNRTLINLGNEPSVAAQRGEEIEDVAPPEEGLSDDLSDLLSETEETPEDGTPEETPDQGEEAGGAGEEEAPSEAGTTEEPAEESASEELDFSDQEALLSDLDELGGEEPESEEPEAEASPDEDLSFLDEEFGFEDDAEPADESEAGEEEPDAAEGEEEDFEAQDAFADSDVSEDEDPFSGVELGEDFEESLTEGEGEEPEPEPDTEEPAAEEEESDEGEDAFDLGDLDNAFDLSDTEELEDEGFEEAAPDEAGPEEEESGETTDEFEIEGGEGFTFEDEEEFEAGEAAEAEDMDEVGDEVDEFSLGDFGAEFGVLEEAGEEDESALNPALDVSGPPPSAPEGGLPETEFSEEDFERLQQTLANLPLNVKIAAEEVIGDERGSPEQIEQLTNMLVNGESAKRIADHCSRCLGRDIQVPRNYERRTGAAFEQDKESFAYQFRENILPVLRVVAITGVAAALLIFLGYRFVYQPLVARNMYERGLDAIEQGEYQTGNQWFDRAVEVNRVKGRYYEYAETFIDERQYARAEEKYDQLLAAYPGDKKGILDYAALETDILGNYEKAEELLNRILADEPYDYDALLAAGDNYMEWAEEDPSKYEDARVAYATLLQQHGQTDLLLQRMLLYFIRTDKLEEVLRLRNYFQGRPRADINPYIYAEMGGYLVTKDRLNGVLDILQRSLEIDEAVPDTHYHLARYYARTEDPLNQRRGLSNAISYFRAREPLEARRAGRLVDSYTRLGEYYYEREEFLTARENLESAVQRYEQYESRGLLEPQPRYGRAYASLGDIAYYVSREYGQAFELYAQAEQNAYGSPELDYKQGYIHYAREEHQAALNEFYNAEPEFRRNRNLLYAIANALYQRGAYSSAQGIYAELLSMLQRQRDRITNLLVDQDPEHRALIDYLIRVNNNLGVTLQQIARRQSDTDVGSRSLFYLQQSAEYATNLSRDERTGVRSASIALPQINLRDILYPREEYDVQIYNELPQDFEDRDF